MRDVDFTRGEARCAALGHVFAVKLGACVVEQGTVRAPKALCGVDAFEAPDAQLVALALALVAALVGEEAGLERAVALAPKEFVAVGRQGLLGECGGGGDEGEDEEEEGKACVETD